MSENIDASIQLDHGSEYVSPISLALRGLQPNQRRRKAKEFIAHFDEIKALIEQGVSYKDVRLALAKGGLPMSAATFKKMFEAETEQRAQTTGDVVHVTGDQA